MNKKNILLVLVYLTKEEKKIKSNAFLIALDHIENSGFELVYGILLRLS